jgi:hypothetical protein
MKIFLPCTDDMLDGLESPGNLVPYRLGLTSIGQLTAAARASRQSRSSTSVSPGCAPMAAAVPALSSSTYRAGPLLE